MKLKDILRENLSILDEIDLNLKKQLDIKALKDNSIEMGSIFDFFDIKSNTFSKEINNKELKDRLIHRNLMIKYGFKPYDKSGGILP